MSHSYLSASDLEDDLEPLYQRPWSKLGLWFEARPAWMRRAITLGLVWLSMLAVLFLTLFLAPVPETTRADSLRRPACSETNWTPSNVLWTLLSLAIAHATQSRSASAWWPRQVLSWMPLVAAFDSLFLIAMMTSFLVQGVSWHDACTASTTVRAQMLHVNGDLLWQSQGQASQTNQQSIYPASEAHRLEDKASQQAGPTRSILLDSKATPHGSDISSSLTSAATDKADEIDLYPGPRLVELPSTSRHARRSRIVQAISVAVVLYGFVKINFVTGALGTKAVAYIYILSFTCTEIVQSGLRGPQPGAVLKSNMVREMKRYESITVYVYRNVWWFAVWIQYVMLTMLYVIAQEIALMNLLPTIRNRFSLGESMQLALQFTWALPLSQVLTLTMLFPFYIVKGLLTYSRGRWEEHQPYTSTAWWIDSCRAMWQYAAIVLPLLIAYNIIPIGTTTTTFENGVPPFAQLPPLQYNCSGTAYVKDKWWTI